MEIVVRDEWIPTKSLEIFYTSESRHIIYKENSLIYIKNLEDPSSVLKIDLGAFHCAFLSLSIDTAYRILAFQLCSSEIVFLNTDSSSMIRKRFEGKVIGYHWLQFEEPSQFLAFTSSRIEFLIVKCSGIHTLDLYQIEIGSYWYNHSTGMIAVALKPPNQGEICLFQIVQSSYPPIQYLGNLTIDCSENMNKLWECSLLNKNCLLAGYNQKDFLVSLEKIYDELYFLYLNTTVGVLELTNISSKNTRVIQVKPGMYKLIMVDNLIILVNFNMKISFIIDVKSNKYAKQPFAIVVHPDNPLKTSILEDKKELFGYDLPYNIVQSLVSLNTNLIYIDRDLSLDNTGKVYQTVIIPDVVTEAHPDCLESVSFLYRREGCKIFMLKHLRNLIKDKLPIRKLMKIFSKIKITQTDLYSVVFKPLLKEDLAYLFSVLTSYINYIYANRRSLNISIGILLAKVCIQLDRLQLLYDLIQCHVIKDSLKLVSVLRKTLASSVGNRYQTTVLILSDVLFRLKDYHSLSELHMEHSYEYENVFFLYRHSMFNYDAEHVCKYVNNFDFCI